MKGELLAPGKPSFTKPFLASGALLQWTLSSPSTRGAAMKKQNIQQNPKNTKEQEVCLKTMNGTSGVMGNRLLLGLRLVTATRQLKVDHSQSHQAQNAAEHTEVKQRRAWTREEIREVVWCYMYCRQHFTENYKKMYDIWRQRNPESRMYMDTKKLLNQKNYIMKHNKRWKLRK